MSNLINTQINPLAARFDLPQSEALYNAYKVRTPPTIGVYPPACNAGLASGGPGGSRVWRSDVPDASTVTPFVLQTTPTTINGVAVPAGDFVRDTYINHGTITNAKIANLAVDDAKGANLCVSKLTAGEINTGDIDCTGTAVVGGVMFPSWTINCSTGLAVFAGSSQAWRTPAGEADLLTLGAVSTADDGSSLFC